MGEVQVIPCHQVVMLIRVLNVHIEDITITTHILLIQSKIYHESVNNKLTS